MSSCKHNISPRTASVLVAQCSSTVLVLVPFQESFFVDVESRLSHQSGSGKNLLSCLVDPSGILL